jgi:hypothetical protein
MYSLFDNASYWFWICNLWFGDLDAPAADSINEKFGGLDIVNRIDRVLYVNGDIDPWHWLGINPEGLMEQNKSMHMNGNEMIFIPNASHCQDLRINNVTPELKDAYNRIIEVWTRWLS